MTEQNKDATDFEEDRDIVDRLFDSAQRSADRIFDEAANEILNLRSAVEGIKEGAAIRIADLEKELDLSRKFHLYRIGQVERDRSLLLMKVADLERDLADLRAQMEYAKKTLANYVTEFNIQ